MWFINDKAKAIIEDVVKRVLNLKGGPGIRVMNTPSGITISALTPELNATPASQSGQVFKAKITAIVGWSFPFGTFTLQRFTQMDLSKHDASRYLTDGHNLTPAFLGTEFGPTGSATQFTYGTGSLITNVTTGAVNSTSCLIIPPGVGAVVDAQQTTDTTGSTCWLFSLANSAQ